MEQQLYQGFAACGLLAPPLRVEVPLGNSPDEAEDIPLKAFGNWRAKFKAEPQA
jgi:hypothetical protein